MIKSISKYAFINAKVRAMIGSFFSQETIDNLINTRDIDELYDVLKTTNYKNIFNKFDSSSDLKLAEIELFKEHISVYLKILKNLKGPSFEFIFLMLNKLEIENLKNIIRLWHQKKISEGRYIVKEKICYKMPIDEILSAQSIEEVISLLDKTPYKNPLLKAKEIFNNRGSLFYLETALDIDFYERLYESVLRLDFPDRSSSLKLLGIEIDIENIIWIFRLKQYYSVPPAELENYIIPHGYRIDKAKIKNIFPADIKTILSEFAVQPYEKLNLLITDSKDKSGIFLIEAMLWELLIQEAKTHLGKNPFSIGVIIGYLILKNAEVKNIISLIYSKLYQLKPERIRESIKC